MKQERIHFTMEYYCRIIELLDSCMDDYLYVYSIKEDSYFISPSAKKRFCIAENYFTNAMENHQKFVYKDDVKMLMDDLKLLASGKKDAHDLEYRWLSVDGKPIWINCRGRLLRDEQGKPEFLLGCINEIGAKQKADNVSGLLGEFSFRKNLEQVASPGKKGFLLRIGIDNFKDINENKGMEFGDRVLCRTAECIKQVIRPGQNLYRIVADEFMVMDSNGGTISDGETLFRQIQQEVEQLIADRQYEVVFTVSGGILDFADMQGDVAFSHLMRLSEYSLNEAKRKGRNRCYRYCTIDYERYLRQKRLTEVMRYAMHHDYEGFEAYYQPIVNAVTHELEGAETLMRFHTEEFGMVSPVEFIPILEETGLIIPMGKWILNEALKLCKQVQEYVPHFRINVNLSYAQIIKSNVFDEIVERLDHYNLHPSDIVIELTESGFLESDEQIKKFCCGLQENHIQLALDDFGTGYSNFHYLYDLKPDIIKIDRSFTMKALENEYEYKLLNHMVDMAHNLKLKMCIEGIETHEDLDTINRLKPDYIQGYYFGKPCPAEELLETYIKQ